ncbi:MAG TPA: YibE/F family protein [Candidatus Limnocylindria bacterium]|nr:YibE/F family protein [Candidatus Limnocylindria bacterium]
MRWAPLLLAALALGACADWNTGQTSSVIDAHVVRVVTQGTRAAGQPGLPGQPFQTVEVELDGGLYRGDRVTLEWGGRVALNSNGLLVPGDHVLVSQHRGDNDTREYAIEDVVRLPSLLPFVIVLVVALVAVARWKGIASLAGLAGSVAVFLLAIVPAVQRGDDPLVATLAGALAVLVVAVFVVHGFNRKSLAALVGTSVCLLIVVALAAVVLAAARITGFGSEEAVFLAIGSAGRIDLHRLVLAGIVVGSLGALVDMGIGQASATFELAAAHEDMRGQRLYASALNVGRDHIGSLVNTLALAYFGGAMPLIVLLSLGNLPLSLAANSETIVGSIIAVLVASIGLVLCVPITTAIAVALAGRGRLAS